MTKSTDIYFPTGELEKSVFSNIWRLTDHNIQSRKEIILPKGTVEIIFNFSGTINYFNPAMGVSKLLPVVFVNGINFKPFNLLKSGRQEFLGIQLKSAGLRLLFNLSVKEFNDCVYAGNEVGCQLELLAEELSSAQAFHQQVEMILKWVRRRISGKSYPYAIERIQKMQYLSLAQNLTVKELCHEICLSDRQLRRFSLDWLGMKTEEFINYNRYLAGLQLLHHSDGSLTEIGLKAGYYDQSHFIRAFKHYTELTPGEYRAGNAEYPGHLSI